MKAWIGSVRTMSKSDVVDAGEQVECVCVCVRVRLSQSGMCAATEPFVRARALEAGAIERYSFSLEIPSRRRQKRQKYMGGARSEGSA